MWRYLALRKFGAIFIETLLLVCCVLAAYYIRLKQSPLSWPSPDQILPKAVLIAAIFQLSLHLKNIYGFKRMHSSREYFFRLCHALAMAAIILCILYYAAPDLMVGRGVFGRISGPAGQEKSRLGRAPAQRRGLFAVAPAVRESGVGPHRLVRPLYRL